MPVADFMFVNGELRISNELYARLKPRGNNWMAAKPTSAPPEPDVDVGNQPDEPVEEPVKPPHIDPVSTRDNVIDTVREMRYGYGANTKIGTNIVKVDGGAALLDALKQPESIIVPSRPLDIELNKPLLIAQEVTLAAMGAPVVFKGLPLLGGKAMTRAIDGNVAMVNFVLDGSGIGDIATALMPRTGSGYFLSHFTITGFQGDDGISVGMTSRPKISADMVTIDHYKADNTSKGILLDMDDGAQHERDSNGKPRRGGLVTIGYSYLNARDRNPRISGAYGAHLVCCVTGPDIEWAVVDCANNGKGANAYEGEALLICESNYHMKCKARSGAYLRATKGPKSSGTMRILHDGKSVFEEGLEPTKGNVQLLTPEDRARLIPYAMKIMEPDQVLRHVKKHAGATL